MPLKNVEYHVPDSTNNAWDLVLVESNAGEAIQCAVCHRPLHPVKNAGQEQFAWERFERVKLGVTERWMGDGYVCLNCRPEKSL